MGSGRRSRRASTGSSPRKQLAGSGLLAQARSSRMVGSRAACIASTEVSTRSGTRGLTWHGRCLGAVLGAEAMRLTSSFGRRWPVMARPPSSGGCYRFAPETIHVTAPIRRRAKRRVPRALLVDPRAGGPEASGEGHPGHLACRARCSISPRSSPARSGSSGCLERAEELELFDLARRRRRSSTAPAATAGAGGSGGPSLSTEPDPAFTRSRFEQRLPAAASQQPASRLPR